MGQVISEQELEREISAFKSQGRKIVFTNGCFDILHVGHVRYLKEAKKLGDILIVGLNSDKSIASLKPFRPIIPETERAEILSSLEMVDYVVIFNEETPYELIKKIRPDILVKGGDWKRENIIGSDLVPMVLSLSFFEGISTSEIIKRIVERFSKKL